MRTNRLQIRRLVSEDWKAMQALALDFHQSEYAIYDMPLPTDEKEIRALTQQFADSQMFFAVMLDEAMIGYVCFHEDHGSYDLGYCFHSDYHGKGYAFEGCSTAMEWIAKERTVKTFTAGTALANLPSCRLLKRLGFVLKQTEKLSFCKDENGHDLTFEGGLFVKDV